MYAGARPVFKWQRTCNKVRYLCGVYAKMILRFHTEKTDRGVRHEPTEQSFWFVPLCAKASLIARYRLLSRQVY